MQPFLSFYNSLDVLNKIMFFGIIIVIILTIITLIIYSKKSKIKTIKPKEKTEDVLEELPIIDKEYISNENIQKEDINSISFPTVSEEDTIIKEPEQLEIIIEEENNNKEIEEPKIKNLSLFDDIENKPSPNKAYQRNVFREMKSRYQTSPIGIVYPKEREVKVEQPINNKEYIQDVSEKLSKATIPDKIELTDYEKEQEENAIISYEELMKKKDEIKVCLVGSSGGHLTHLYMLKPFWKDKNRFWVTFDKEDARSLLEGEKVYPCYFPTNRSIKALIKNTKIAWDVLHKEKPDLIISCGAAVAVPFFYIGKMMGAKLVYIEVFDRIDKPTMTGKMVYPIVDKFVVQWEEQKKVYPKAVNLGSIF